MPIPLTVEGVDLTLELLLWRAYGPAGQASSMLTAALEANTGIAALGAVLPLGTPVVLPDLTVAKPAPAARTTFNLFGD